MQGTMKHGIATLRLDILQSYAFLARNWHLTRRYWDWEVVWFFYALTSSLSVVFIAQGAEAITGNSPGFDVKYLKMYLIIGTLVWRYLSNIFMLTSEVIAWEHWEGTIEYTLMAPVLDGAALPELMKFVWPLLVLGIVLDAADRRSARRFKISPAYCPCSIRNAAPR